jgi:hypothetical protein
MFFICSRTVKRVQYPMPSPYRRDVARLKAEIVARVDAGEALRAVCASPGLPAEHTARVWAKADPAFGAALAAARRQGAWRRLWTFDEAQAAAFLARARSGEPINSLFGQPGMPSRETYRRWKAAQPPFAEAVHALRQRRDAQLGEKGRARRRPFDQALADRIIVRLNAGVCGRLRLEDVLAGDPDLPGAVILTRWRREQPEFDQVLRMIASARRWAVAPVPEPVVDRVVSHIVEGGSLASFSRLPGAPSQGKLRRWRRDPNFARKVARACEWREEWYRDQILMAAQDAAPGTAKETQRRIGALKRHLGRLCHRPGPVRR